jgi:MFS family permease
MDATVTVEARGTLDFTQKLVVLLSGLLSSLSLTAITSVLPSISSHLAHGPNDAMLVKQLIGAVTLAMAVGAPTGGYIADKIGLRPTLFGASVIYSVAGTAGLYLNSLPLLLGSRLVLGLAAATIQVLGLAMINTTLAGNARAKWMGLHFFVAIFGTLFIIPLAGQLGEISWRMPFALYAAGLILVLGLLWPQGERAKGTEAAAVVAGLSTPAAAVEVGTPTLAGFPWHYLPLAFVLGALTFLPTIAIPFQLREQVGASPSTIAYVMTGTAAIGAVMALLYGRARLYLSTHAAFLLSLGLNFAGAFIATNSSSFALIVTGLLIMGAGAAWFSPNILIAVGAKVTPALQGRAAGLLKAAQFLSAPIAILLVQPYVKRYGEVIALKAVAAIALLMFVLMAVRTIKKPR